MYTDHSTTAKPQKKGWGLRKEKYVPYSAKLAQDLLPDLKLRVLHLGEDFKALPVADGTENQGIGEMTNLFRDWEPLRTKLMRCGQEGIQFLKENVYNQDWWKNYDRLKKQQTRYREWKKQYDAHKWQTMPPEAKAERLAAKRKSYQKSWWSTRKRGDLALRVLKRDPKAQCVPAHGPVMNQIVKHSISQQDLNRHIREVNCFIAALHYRPNQPETLENLKGALKWIGATHPDDLAFMIQLGLKHYDESEDKKFDQMLEAI